VTALVALIVNFRVVFHMLNFSLEKCAFRIEDLTDFSTFRCKLETFFERAFTAHCRFFLAGSYLDVSVGQILLCIIILCIIAQFVFNYFNSVH